MHIKRVIVGDLQANCYILINEDKAIIIDPGDDKEKILQELNNLDVVGILLTHNHFDHMGELKYFEDKYHLKHNEKIPYFNYEVINTPGHTKDSKTFYFKEYKIMFTGDFLFKGTIGRMDLAGGSETDMASSLKLISQYDDDITIYPGHGECSTLKEEKKYFRYYI
jgi:glyoxylase-like metal-dependent hydrolase (beta-lactamase superfamily II)